jgi:hypothetical protein
MGRFSVTVEKTEMRSSNVDAASVVSLLLQGVSAEKRCSNTAFSRLSFSSVSTMLPMPEKAFGNDDTGFVTFGDYGFPNAETRSAGWQQ